MGQVLVLNASYEPLNITTWRRAVVMMLKGKAESWNTTPVDNCVKAPTCRR